MNPPIFLSLEEVFYINEEEIKTAGVELNIRDIEALKVCGEAL